MAKIRALKLANCLIVCSYSLSIDLARILSKATDLQLRFERGFLFFSCVNFTLLNLKRSGESRKGKLSPKLREMGVERSRNPFSQRSITKAYLLLCLFLNLSGEILIASKCLAMLAPLHIPHAPLRNLK